MLSYLSKQELKFLSNRNGKLLFRFDKLTIDRLAKDRVVSIPELLVERKKREKLTACLKLLKNPEQMLKKMKYSVVLNTKNKRTTNVNR